jgi:hypothetical protein
VAVTDGPARVGGRFARLLAAKQWLQLCELLAPHVVFRGMTPGRFWEAHSPDDVVVDVLRHWFEDTDHIEELIGVETGDVADRHWLRYRLLVRTDDGLHLVEQHGYYDIGADGRIERLRLMCAGFRPIEDRRAAPAPRHDQTVV